MSGMTEATPSRLARRRLAGVIAALAVAGACSFEGEGGGGCGGTPGEHGLVTFNFEQAAAEDLSDGAGNAFASETTARVAVHPTGDDPLPDVLAESSDPAVFSVGSSGDPDYPFQVGFHRTGIATLRVLDASDRSLIDEVDLRVADPHALRLAVSHPMAPDFDGGGLIGEPEKVVLAPGAECRLYTHLTDGTEAVLYGVFSPVVSGATIVSFADEGMISAGLVGASVHAAQRVTALAEGIETVAFAGPNGLRRTVEFEVAAAPDVAALAVALWPGYVAEWQAGQETFLTATGRLADGSPAYGFSVEFATSDPAVVTAEAWEGEPDIAVVSFVGPGAATITARLAADPSVTAAFDVTVVPPETEGE
jgi:hypothetical protein